MIEAGPPMVVIGGLLLAGLLADWVAARLPVPRVSVLILLGVAAGPVGFDLLPAEREQWFPVVSAVALVMVGFLIGGEFTRDRLREIGRASGTIAVVEALATATVVGVGLVALGVQPQLALPLAGVATATAPAAVVAVVRESGREGRLSQVLRAVVAFDDAISLVVFSVLIVASGALFGAPDLVGPGAAGLWELGGAVGLGLGLGIPAASLTGRLQPGYPILEEALGLVLLCAGLGLWLDVSYLLASVVMGMVVANLAPHHERPFREIEGIEWPFLVVFFVLAGAALELSALTSVGAVGVAYVGLRVVGKVGGAWLGATLVNESPVRRRWLGPALLPQAGVALGLALLAQQRLPGVGSDLLAIVVGATVVFELLGPILTRLALQRAD